MSGRVAMPLAFGLLLSLLSAPATANRDVAAAEAVADMLDVRPLSLLQVNVELQRGGVGEMAPSTMDGASGRGRQASNISSNHSAEVAAVPKCDHCFDLHQQAAPPEHFEEDDGFGAEDDELAAAVSQVSLVQTGISVQRGASRMEAFADMHLGGIEDEEEALGLMDAAAEFSP
mmetsp:Transcript_130696/g.419129  ORF Transcript_130696/g.419129 Transcript_130696/m.419129 type:complete len:174 (+) Transcript_130696:106-627(+)